MPLYPLILEVKTVFVPVGVAVAVPLELTVEPTYVIAIDVRPVKSLTVNITYETRTDVKPAQSLTVNITYTYTVTLS